MGLRQSMSRRGNCWDNAPQESLFGHMKDEIRVSVADTHQKIQEAVLNRIAYYNNERYQWSLAKLAPAEYYRFVTTGEYPIPEEVLGERFNGYITEELYRLKPLRDFHIEEKYAFYDPVSHQ